jgi:Protein of unknown function (DUF4231)
MKVIGVGEDRIGLREYLRQLFSFDSSIENYKQGQNDIHTYIESRFVRTQRYYKIKALTYKWMYFILSIVIVIIGAFIPIINAVDPHKTFVIYYLPIISLLGASVAIISSILTLVKVQEFWMSYASTLNEIETEYERYIHSIGEAYSDKERKVKEQQFIQNLENLIMSNRRQYVSARKGNGTPSQDANHTGTKETSRKSEWQKKPRQRMRRKKP